MSRSPFRIAELYIRSFRGIDELHLTLPQERAQEGKWGGLAILAGDNGCGKTSVLEAILLVLGKQDLLPADTAPLDEQVRFGAADFLIEAVIQSTSGEQRTLRVDRATAEKATLEADVQYFSARREPESLGETPDPRGARSVREARRVVELKKRLVNMYYRRLRDGKGGQMPEDSPFLKVQRFIQRFLGEDHILDILPVSNDPGSDSEVIVRRAELPGDVTSLAMARRAAAEGRSIPPIIPIDRLSSGQVALFSFAGPLVFRDAPLDIVLIDEPEQHMHVQWQRHIVDALHDLAPESQLIVATHSLDVLDSALSSERILLVRDDDPRARLPPDLAAAE